jgi:tRNA-dependent cyclodipeptide synthase
MILLLRDNMSINITNYINTTPEQIELKQHNIYLGISISNHYFSKKNVAEYLTWAIQNSRTTPLILIADELQAYNYQAFYDMNYNKAISTAKNIGDEIHRMSEKVIRTLNQKYEYTKQIPIVHICDIATDMHKEKQEILEQEFRDNTQFKSEITKIITANLKTKILTPHQQTLLSKYILAEIPLQNNMQYNGIQYNLYPYPGTTTGILMNDLAQRRIFPEIANKIDMRIDNAFVEAYIN